jgi:hypothetical protein
VCSMSSTRQGVDEQLMRGALEGVARPGTVLGDSGGGAELAPARPGKRRHERRPSVATSIVQGVRVLKIFAKSLRVSALGAAMQQCMMTGCAQ